MLIAAAEVLAVVFAVDKNHTVFISSGNEDKLSSGKMIGYPAQFQITVSSIFGVSFAAFVNSFTSFLHQLSSEFLNFSLLFLKATLHNISTLKCLQMLDMSIIPDVSNNGPTHRNIGRYIDISIFF